MLTDAILIRLHPWNGSFLKKFEFRSIMKTNRVLETNHAATVCQPICGRLSPAPPLEYIYYITFNFAKS